MSNRLFDPNDPDPVVGCVAGPGPASSRQIRRSQVTHELFVELAMEHLGYVPDVYVDPTEPKSEDPR